MSKLQPLDDLEMHELLRLMYPEHIRSDDDAYFELSQQACESIVDLGDGFEVPLPELLARDIQAVIDEYRRDHPEEYRDDEAERLRGMIDTQQWRAR